METVWEAMKTVHYKRLTAELERTIQDAARVEEAITAALNTVVTAVHAQAGTFWYYDRFGDGRIHPAAVYGGSDLQGISLPPGEGVAGHVIQTGKSVIIPNCREYPQWAGKTDDQTGFQTDSMICVPMVLEGFVFGCIQIINRTDDMAYDVKDLNFAVDLAAAASDLFSRQGLLNDCLRKLNKACTQADPTFLEIVQAENDGEMEQALRQMEEFTSLRDTDQASVLQLSRKLRDIFRKRAPRKREKWWFGGK